MKPSLNISLILLLLVSLASSLGCTRAAYERMEERSLPRYQQGVPVMSNIVSTCKRVDLFEPGNFKLSYDRLEDLTVYPTPPQYPPRFESKYCINGERKILHVDAKEPLSSEQKANTGYRNDEVIKYAEKK